MAIARCGLVFPTDNQQQTPDNQQMNHSDSSWVRTVTLVKPTLQDNTADTDRLISALKTDLQTDALHVDLNLLKELPEILRKMQYNATSE